MNHDRDITMTYIGSRFPKFFGAGDAAREQIAAACTDAASLKGIDGAVIEQAVTDYLAGKVGL